jgi:hypothetical protein
MFDYITLDKYNPLLNKAYQLIDDAGKPLDAKWKPGLDKAQILKAYKDLLFERTADLMAVSYHAKAGCSLSAKSGSGSHSHRCWHGYQRTGLVGSSVSGIRRLAGKRRKSSRNLPLLQGA